MVNKYSTLNKIILYTIESYIEKSRDDGAVLLPLHSKLVSAIKGYRVMHLFGHKESTLVISFLDDDRLKKIIEQDVSFIVFALQLVKLWVDSVPKENRPHLNISDKRLALGRGLFVIDMLKLKQRDAEQHAKTKEIIDTSVICAKQFFAFHEEKLVK